MSMQGKNGQLTFIAGAALAIYRRVKHDTATGKVVYAGATDAWQGVTQGMCDADTDPIEIRLRNDPGTFFMTAAGAITANALVYAAADGKIAGSGTVLVGYAKEAATADNDQIEVLPLSEMGLAVPGAPSVTVANSATPDGNAAITIQAKDLAGNNIAARCVVKVWFATTGAYAAPADLGTLTASTGTILKEDTDDALATCVTDANGALVLALDTASDGTVHAMAEIAGRVGTGNAAITGN
jgi:hypothetical protein